jgi:dihydrolipoamide dehydrogenase
VWRRLGAKVTVVEYAPSILPGNDDELVREADKILRKQGLEIHVGTKVIGAMCAVTASPFTSRKDGATSSIEGDYVLVSVGRKPAMHGVDAAALGLTLGARGEITVDDQQRTNLPNVFAIGDVWGQAAGAQGRGRGVLSRLK